MSRTMPRIRKAPGGRIPHSFARLNVRESQAPTSPLRVDRERCIVIGVKVLGNESPNTHGKPVDGTKYTRAAHQSALSLCEGRRVYANHKPRRSIEDRRIEDRLGKLQNAVVMDDGVHADLHLIKTHALTENILWAAENMPDAFCLSIDADGHGEIKNRQLVIDKILEVRSVDVVAEGGTTTSLSESKRKIPMKLREALQKIKLPEKDIVRLFEMGEGSLLKPDMEAAAPEGEAEESYEQHLGKAIVAILNDESMDQEAKKKKVLGILKLTGDEEEAPTETPVVEGDEEGDDKPKKDDDDKPVKESLERKVKQLERKDHVRTLCESKGYLPSKAALNALTALDSDKDALELIESLKAAPANGKQQTKGSGPARSSAGTVPVKESKTPADAAEQAKYLLR